MRLLCPTSTVLCLAVLVSAPAQAQQGTLGETTVVQAENVRLDYAHVLNVEPVYQTLRASRTEMQCEEAAPSKPAARKKEIEEDPPSQWSRLVSSVKGVFVEAPDEPPAPVEPPKPECRLVPVKREFRRPIAYDVDYVYKGMQYRSRLAEDPGNRIRIRVSVMPYVPGQTVALP